MKTRCEDCGWASTPNEPQCLKDPDAWMRPWPARMTYAYAYVVKFAQQLDGNTGALEWLLRKHPMTDLTGCRRVDLRDALMYARRWRLPEFAEGEDVKPITSKGLYG